MRLNARCVRARALATNAIRIFPSDNRPRGHTLQPAAMERWTSTLEWKNYKWQRAQVDDDDEEMKIILMNATCFLHSDSDP